MWPGGGGAELGLRDFAALRAKALAIPGQLPFLTPQYSWATLR